MAFLEERAGMSFGESLHMGARLAFEFSSGRWQASGENISSVPTEWTAVLHGESLGQIRTAGVLRSLWFCEKDSLVLPADQMLPDVGPRTEEFAGWMGTAVKRPVVLLERPYFRDPEQWRKKEWNEPVPRDLIFAFRRFVVPGVYDDKAPGVANCEFPEKDVVNCAFPDKDLEIADAYQSKSGKLIVKMRFRKDSETLRVLSAGQYPWHVKGIDSPDPNSFWFSKSGADLLYLGDNLVFLDVGDFDSDGRSEIVFFLSRYDEDGYLILWDGLKRTTKFSWSYH
jgi:hypothetical protein